MGRAALLQSLRSRQEDHSRPLGLSQEMSSLNMNQSAQQDSSSQSKSFGRTQLLQSLRSGREEQSLPSGQGHKVSLGHTETNMEELKVEAGPGVCSSDSSQLDVQAKSSGRAALLQNLRSRREDQSRNLGRVKPITATTTGVDGGHELSGMCTSDSSQHESSTQSRSSEPTSKSSLENQQSAKQARGTSGTP